MTITVLPWSTKRRSTSSSLRMSSKCRARRGLVEDVQGPPGLALAEFASQLHALRLPAGNGRRGLP